MKRIFALSIAIILTMLCGCTKNVTTDSYMSLTSNTFSSTETTSENKETEKVEKNNNSDACVRNNNEKDENNNDAIPSTKNTVVSSISDESLPSETASPSVPYESEPDPPPGKYEHKPVYYSGFLEKYVNVPSPEDYHTSAIIDIPTITESNKYEPPYATLKANTKTTYYGYEGFFFVCDFSCNGELVHCKKLGADVLTLKAKDVISLSDFAYAGITVPDDEMEYFVVAPEFIGPGSIPCLAFFAFIGTQEDKENLCNNIKNGLDVLSIPVAINSDFIYTIDCSDD